MGRHLPWCTPCKVFIQHSAQGQAPVQACAKQKACNQRRAASSFTPLTHTHEAGPTNLPHKAPTRLPKRTHRDQGAGRQHSWPSLASPCVEWHVPAR